MSIAVAGDMSLRSKMSVVILILLIAVSAIGAILIFGDQKVIAFGTAMSFIAATGAAVAAWGYLRETAEVVQSTKASVEQQARVAETMEADLRFRIAPNLQFRSKGGLIADQSAEVENVGRGVAVETVGKITFQPTNREQTLNFDNWLEPNRPVTIKYGQVGGETGFTVELTCTDSVRLNKYSFALINGRTVIGVVKMPPSSQTE